MKKPTDSLLEDFLAAGASNPIRHAFRYGLKNKEFESFGVFLYEDLKSSCSFLELPNLNSANPHQFTANNQSFYQHYLSENIVALFHTHIVDSSELSELDIAISSALGLPSLVLSTSSKSTSLYYPVGYKPPPLKGRIFIPFLQDCISYFRDFYFLNLGINLNQYVKDWARKEDESNDYLIDQINNLFYEVNINERQYGDLILFYPQEFTYHHVGVVDHDESYSHHPVGFLPKTELFNDFTLNKVYKIYRYKDL